MPIFAFEVDLNVFMFIAEVALIHEGETLCFFFRVTFLDMPHFVAVLSCKN